MCVFYVQETWSTAFKDFFCLQKKLSKSIFYRLNLNWECAKNRKTNSHLSAMKRWLDGVGENWVSDLVLECNHPTHEFIVITQSSSPLTAIMNTTSSSSIQKGDNNEMKSENISQEPQTWLALPKWLCADLSTNMLNPFTEKDGLCELPQLRNDHCLQLAFFRLSRLNYDSLKCSCHTKSNQILMKWGIFHIFAIVSH